MRERLEYLTASGDIEAFVALYKLLSRENKGKEIKTIYETHKSQIDPQISNLIPFCSSVQQDRHPANHLLRFNYFSFENGSITAELTDSYREYLLFLRSGLDFGIYIDHKPISEAKIIGELEVSVYETQHLNRILNIEARFRTDEIELLETSCEFIESGIQFGTQISSRDQLMNFISGMIDPFIPKQHGISSYILERKRLLHARTKVTVINAEFPYAFHCTIGPHTYRCHPLELTIRSENRHYSRVIFELA